MCCSLGSPAQSHSAESCCRASSNQLQNHRQDTGEARLEMWACVWVCVCVCVRDESSHSGRRTGSSGWRHAHQEQNWFGWKQPHLRVRRWIGSCLRTLLQYYCSNQNCNIRNEIQTAMKCYKNIFTSIRTMQKHFFEGTKQNKSRSLLKTNIPWLCGRPLGTQKGNFKQRNLTCFIQN